MHAPAADRPRLQRFEEEALRRMEEDLRELRGQSAPAALAAPGASTGAVGPEGAARSPEPLAAPAAAPLAGASPPSAPPPSPAKESLMQKMLRTGSRWPNLILAFWTVLGLAVLGGVAWVWFSLIPRMWGAGFATGVNAWTAPAAAGILLAAVLPTGAAFATWQKVAAVYREYLSGRASMLDVQRAAATTGLEEAMKQVAKELGRMGALLHWSQRELATYHQDALRQKKRAFRNAMVATWLGFALLLVGAVPMLLPSAAPLPDDPDRNGLVVVAGVVTNAVGVMFYFMYRDSQARATEYYDRQRFGHHVAMCYLMAEDLDGPAQDAAIHLILAQVLGHEWHVERPKAPWDDLAALRGKPPAPPPTPPASPAPVPPAPVPPAPVPPAPADAPAVTVTRRAPPSP